jgi:diguanylate cyclase (GGDEF)-like protein
MSDGTSTRGIYAALSATNAAILRTTSADDLFSRICEAAVQESGFKACFIATPVEPNVLRYVANAGSDPRMPGIDKMPIIQVGLGSENRHGLVGEVYLTGLPAVANDYLADPRLEPYRAFGAALGVRSAAAIPILRNGLTIAVIALYHDVANVFDDEVVALMVKMADNVSLALDDFERERKRHMTDLANRRLKQMYAALSATNEAIMRTSSPAELFQRVCDSAVNGSGFKGAGLVVPTGEHSLRYVAATGRDGMPSLESLPDVSLLDDGTQTRGLIGEAFTSAKPCFTNDYLNDPRIGAWRAIGEQFGVMSAASIPILRDGHPVGVIVFYLDMLGAIDEEMVSLMTRMAENIAFALDNFDRAEARAKADARIQYLATHDEMTGLPNRLQFSQILNASIKTSAQHDRKFAVLFIDLDRFKVINDTLGHDVGDRLLAETGRRITGCLRADDIVARLGGDEFVVVLNEVRGRDGVAHVAKNLLAAIGAPTLLSGHECRTTGSIGIAIYPDHGTDEQTLTKRADIAMYEAKADGKNDFRFYSKDIKSQSIESLMLESGLRRALEHREFRVHYQPKVDLSTGDVTGVEALIRWCHPELGMISPVQFIPLAEETGLIVSIGRWVLREACRQNMEWQSLGLPPVTMAVNLSPRQFSDEHLLKDIDEALSDSGMAPEMLQIEVTESMMMRHVERGILLLQQIKSRGIRLAIDDFGSGYSSLGLLDRFPIDTLKIDRSFVAKLDAQSVQGKSRGAIPLAIISMGKALDLTVVAEGVETEEQKAFLTAHGCDEMQGYLFSKPLTSANMVQLLRGEPDPAPLQPFKDRRRILDRRKNAAIASKVAVLH